MHRPLFNKSLGDLNELVSRNLNSLTELDLVRCELLNRSTDAARRLRSAVEQRIAILKTAERSGQAPAAGEEASVSNSVAAISTEVREWTNEAVARLRAKLIDLSRRSPLISFKHTARSASQLRVVDERPDLLWGALQTSGMGFEPLPGEDNTPPDELTAQFHIAYEHARLTDTEFQAATEKLGDSETDARAWQEAERHLRAKVRDQLGLPKLTFGKGLDVIAIAKAHGFDPSYELRSSDDGDLAEHHQDDRIRVLLTQKELEKRLKTIWDRSLTHLRETGLHTLHLVFGFVQWFEDEESDIPLHAPVLLLPVSLDREVRRGRFEYSLKATDDEPTLNISLIEKARKDWGLTLPELRPDETPESYFVRLRPILDRGRRLKLHSFVTLAVLPPMILWKDLDPTAWPEDAFPSHRLLPGLLGAKEVKATAGTDDPIDIDDPAHSDRVPALITDADASQHRAIMDMAAGHDMAIEGPPGTGKSQTITNMIATALALGKRVLFVAEKQAALRVVADRLRNAGFGPLLLELHGDRAVRSDVYDGLRERLESKASLEVRELEERRNELKRHRDLLRRYLSLVRAPLGALGTSAHDLAWREIRLRSRFSQDQISAVQARWSPPQPKHIDRPTLAEHRGLLEQFGRALLEVEAADGGRTRWTLARTLNAFDQSAALEAARTCSTAAEAVAAALQGLCEHGIKAPAEIAELVPLSDALSRLRPFTCTDGRIVAAAVQAADAAEALLKAQEGWRNLAIDLSAIMDKPDGVSLEVTEQLEFALSADLGDETIRDVRSRRSDLAAFTERVAVAERDLQRLIAQLERGNGASTQQAGEVAGVLVQLNDFQGTAASLARSELLTSAAGLIAQEGAERAAALLADKAKVLDFAAPEILGLDPGELDSIAETLEGTGFFGRLGGHFRSTWRRAAKLLTEEADRLAAADKLRTAAVYVRASSEFQLKSRARALFPELLWEGIDSDFSALLQTSNALAQASATLSRVDELDVLSWWLAQDQLERQRFGSACQRLTPILDEAAQNGFSAICLADLQARATSRLQAYECLEAAAATAGLKDDCPLRWDGMSVAEHIRALHKLASDFHAQAMIEPLSWVKDIHDDLSDLRTSLEESGQARRLSPFIAASLDNSSDPLALVQGQIQNAGICAQALTAWDLANERMKQVAGEAALEFAQTEDWREAGKALGDLARDARGASLAANLLKYQSALKSAGLEAFAKAAFDGIVQADKLDDAYELLLVSALLRSYLGDDGEELARLGSLSLEAARKAFRKIDKELHKLEASAIVAKRLKDPVPPGRAYGRKSDYTDLGLIMNEVELTRPRTPLRDVIHRAGAAMQALKPVWMMSPTSVAQFIKPGELSFDLLIVDEASQMRPEFSISCILRAEQFVVVGDANQLPPSDHFQTATNNDNEEEDIVGVDESTESILDLANQRFRKKPRLKWHYRSQHESLIQFSNRQFYDRDLVVFPSPSANDDDLMGVKCTFVPAKRPDTEYEASINQREAEEVIEQAFGLMQRYPNLSIGIVAMNAKQTELIQNEFDRLIVEEATVRRYVEAFAGTIDEFFIKNLENVQGDERDIILISTVYGPGKEGKVRQNFGLMNREVGWRRLNVLVTRAKMSCRLITSLRPDDIKVTESSSRGVIAFKAYLTYAHNGAQYDDASGGETDSDFEIFVADAIRDAGYEVVYQVGVENFRIDLGVRHPSCPIGFIAGIECDGAAYHSGLTVRDRDHIRQSVLEGLGWRIYRVWSTDWFADSARETAKLISWLDSVRDTVAASLPAAPVPEQAPPTADLPAAIEVIRETETMQPELERVSGKESPEQERESTQREPTGRKLRPLGELQPYEAVRGSLYEVWRDEVFLGEVEVMRRATANPRIYGDKILASKSEYEGRVANSGDCFRSFDIYAAMREVAFRAASEARDGEF